MVLLEGLAGWPQGLLWKDPEHLCTYFLAPLQQRTLVHTAEYDFNYH